MATSAADSKLIKPFLHSLSHLALVKIVVPFFKELDSKTLEKVYDTIQKESAHSDEDVKKKFEGFSNRAKDMLLEIPAGLRQTVLKAAMGMRSAVELWKYDHCRYLVLENEECTFYWRKDDGTIDRTKTAQELVLNANINIRHRFNIACLYCLQESVETLWSEMQASGEMENFYVNQNSIQEFWVAWLSERVRVPWLQAAKEHLEAPVGPCAIFSSFFTLMQPEDRQRFLTSFDICAGEDILLCLKSATEEEEQEILKAGTHRLLHFLLHWPMQSFFIETADKLWKFIQLNHYRFLLDKISFYILERNDFDYCRLYVDFYNSSPQHLKEAVQEIPYFREQIYSVFDKMRRRGEPSLNSAAT